jgi:transcriptional antiterminator RfaH
MEQWYTLYTKPNAEYQVATALHKRGIQTYLPQVESPRDRKGRERRPFFPCYLFTRLDLEAVGLSKLQWTPGLRRIVALGDQPVPLPDEVIDLIQLRLDGLNSGDWPTHTYQPGDRLRITDGPLQGLLAIFEGPTTPAKRVRVLLTILGNANRTWVPATDLEKVQPEAKNPAPKRSRRTRGRGRRVKNSTRSQAQPL